VVAIDTSASSAAVKLSTSSYDSNLLGVVSTNPAMVIEGNSLQFMNGNYKVDSRRPAIALAGRVPVKVTNENGNIKPGDYLTSSAQFPGYAMKATASGYVIGQALEFFNSSVINDFGMIIIFIKPMRYEPRVADLLQFGDAANQPLIESLASLNMTDASVFDKLVIKDSLYVGKDLRVMGIIYAATLNVDTVNAKKLCLDDVCITKEELKRLLEMSNQSATPASATDVASAPQAEQVAGSSISAPEPPANGSDNPLSEEAAPAQSPAEPEAKIQPPPAEIAPAAPAETPPPPAPPTETFSPPPAE
jgi:hypothetical protein